MNRVFVIYVDWNNTHGNHSGMAYLCKKLKEDEHTIKLIKCHQLDGRGSLQLNRILSLCYSIYLMFLLRQGDKVFLMEYLTKSTSQEIIAKILRFAFPELKIMGMVHLSGSHLVEQYGSDDKVLSRLKYLNYVYVMGRSLLAYLKGIGLEENKVIRTFHYVDDSFYKPEKPLEVNNRLRVICIGNLKRNFSQLKEIVTQCNDVEFDICQGILNLESLFGSMKNVRLHGFLPETKLRDLMREADISLNVMEDTVGSNVITTSLACGLAMIVSDVGSIRDYCDQSNAIFCQTKQDFIDAIFALSLDRSRCLSMKEESLARAQKYSLANFTSSFKDAIRTH